MCIGGHEEAWAERLLFDTIKLASYGAALRDVLPSVEHRTPPHDLLYT
jgi:hypothetical protein